MALPTEKMKLTIKHVPTGLIVEFPAYLELFSDMYSSTWNAEDVYGRMDPIATFISTQRALSLAWNVPAESFDDARRNMQKINRLMSFLYPLYQDNGGVAGATAINQAPLLRIKFGNLVQNAVNGDGLLGYANGFTFDPAIEFGMFHSTKGSPEYYPKTFRLNTELKVLHEHALGFTKAGPNGKTFSFRGELSSKDFSQYPYGAPPPAPFPAEPRIPTNRESIENPPVNNNAQGANGVGAQPQQPVRKDPLPGTPAAALNQALNQGSGTTLGSNAQPALIPLPTEQDAAPPPKASSPRRNKTPSRTSTAGKSSGLMRRPDDIQ